jgi:hypothetical protein
MGVTDVELKPGLRLKSPTSTTEVIVVKAPSSSVDLRCGGGPMVPHADAANAVGGAPDPAHASGTLLGKRYADPVSGLEVLCTKAGDGSLSLGDEPLQVKDTKPLPSSD